MMVSGLKKFILFKSTSPFDSRCTALDWHPMNHNVLAVGAKYGNIMLWDIETPANDVLIPGVSVLNCFRSHELLLYKLLTVN